MESQGTAYTWNSSPITNYLFTVCVMLWTGNMTDTAAGILSYAIMRLEQTFALQSHSQNISIILSVHFPHSTHL